MNKLLKLIPVFLLIIFFSACTNVETSYWENGNIKSELPYKNGKLNGVARWYYEDGTLQQEVPYVDDMIDGTLRRYHDNGRRETEETWLNNVRNGVAIEYNYPGKRIEQKYYKNDTLHGEYRKWYGNGELQIYGNIVNGLWEGNWLYYSDYGELIGEGKYSKGSGEQRFWNPDGSLFTRTSYKNNLKHGKEYHYRPDGEIDYVMEFEYGEPVMNNE
jgi:antitoxin component YwqK of YwqJK toxin-antitoxin module